MSEEKKNPFGIDENKPADWFEPLYAKAERDGSGVPWANMKTHPNFTDWLTRHSLDGTGKSALVVGCGMGDDAVELESQGFQVTAFDVSDSAIQFCKERFPSSTVDFVQADLLKDQPDWEQKFDFVLEIYTVQALPPKFEDELIQNIAKFVAPSGTLLTVAEVRDYERSFEIGPPWVLTPGHIEKFASYGLVPVERHVDTSTGLEGSDTYVTTFQRQD